MVHPRTDQSIIQRGRQAAQVWILRQRLDHGLGFSQFLGGPDHLRGWQEQQTILLEKRAAPRLDDRRDEVLLRRELLDQGVGGLRRQLRGRGIDYDQNGLFLGGE